MLSLLNTTFTNTLRQGFTLIGRLLSELKARSTYFENQTCTKATLKEIDSAGLLEKASIITTPTAYSDGFLHSVKPEQTLSSELITNGGFDTSIPIGTAGSGWRFIDSSNAGSSGEYYQGGVKLTRTTNLSRFRPLVGNTTSTSFFPLESRNYVISYDLISTTDSSKNVSMSAGGVGVQLPGTVGSHTVYFKNNGTSTICQLSPSSNTDIVLDNISIKEVIDADFTFTRNSPATRVNSQGIVQSVNITGSNVVTNGNFETNTDWTLGDGWSIGANKASCDGTQIAVTNIVQTISTNIQNQLVKISFTLDISAGTLSGSLNASGNTEFVALTTSGNYSVQATSTDVNPTILFQGNADFVGSISNVVIESVTNDTDLPRINYSGGCGSWLLEPSRSNLITYSEDFSQGWSLNGGGVTINQTTSPDGTLNADKLFAQTNNGQHRVDFSSSNASGATTFSFFAKSAEYNTLWVRIGLTTVYFNLEDVESFNNTTATTSSINYYGNGWYRCMVTKEISSANEVCRINLTESYKDASIWTGDGTSGLYIWGAMHEVGSYPTSYMPTQGVVVTRGADLALNSGSSDLINSTEGVLYAEISALANDGTFNFISLSDGTTSNRINIMFNTDNTLDAFVGGVGTFDSVVDILNFNKAAIKYKSGDYAFWVNGVEVEVSTSTSGTHSGLKKLNFDIGNGSNDFYGNGKCVAVFKEALTDSELEALTSWVSFSDMANAQLYTIQ